MLQSADYSEPLQKDSGVRDAETFYAQFEQAFERGLAEHRLDDCAKLLSEISRFGEELGVVRRAWLTFRRAQLSYQQGRLQEVKEICDRLLRELCEADLRDRDRSRLLAETWALRGAWGRRVGQMDEAITSYQRSREEYEALAETENIATIDRHLGQVYRFSGNWRLAVQHYERSLKAAEMGASQAEIAAVLNDLGNVYRLQGRLEEALRCCERSLLLRQTLSNREYLGLSYNTLGMVYRELGELEKAKTFQCKALEVFAETDDDFGKARAHNNLGYIYYREGKFEVALQELTKSLTILESLREQGGSFLANTLDKLGRVYRDLGNYDMAMDLFRQDLERAVAFQDRYQETEAHYGICELYRQKGELALMHAEANQVRLLAMRHGFPYFAARVWEIQGDGWLQQQQYEEAFRCYSAACLEMLNYTRTRYEELASRVNRHLHSAPPADVRKRITQFLAQWTKEHDLEAKENQVGSRVHLVHNDGRRDHA